MTRRADPPLPKGLELNPQTGYRMTLQPDSELAQAATRIARRLQEAGFQAFWVGGSVRDLLLGREPGDYDIATSALTDQVESLFPKTIPVGKKFGVVIVREPPFEFQVAKIGRAHV